MSISVFVIDDHPIVQAGVENVFLDHAEFELVGAAETLSRAVAAMSSLRPDVVLLDVRLEGSDVVQGVDEVLKAASDAHVILFTADPRHPRIPSALRAGAVATITKGTSAADLRAAVRAAFEGRNEIRFESDRPLLTPRQHEVLTGVGKGMTNSEIAAELGLSPATVKAYWQETLQRIGARNRADAISTAHRLGLL